MNILLLEDCKTDAELLIRALKKGWPDWHIEHAYTIDEATKILSEERSFDVALLDIALPDGSGTDLLLKIRQSGRDMAIIMLTGSGNEEVAVAVLKAGADYYMVKKGDYRQRVAGILLSVLKSRKESLRRDSRIINVLYIEHNPSDIDFTKRHLKRYAPYINIEAVPTGEDALLILPPKQTDHDSWRHDVVMVDYRLPGMSALEIIKELRHERGLDIPIIVVTGHGSEELAVQSLKLGANEYLVKGDNYLDRLPSLITGAYEHCELRRKQSELEKSEAKYRLLAKNSADIIFTLDFDLNYTYVSPAVYQMRGYRPEELVGKSIIETVTPATHRDAMEVINRMLPQIKEKKALDESVIIELETFRKDGSTLWVETKASVAIDNEGNPVGIQGVSRDISERKVAEKRLIEALKRAQGSDRLKSAFISNISHEIRTPLNSIIGFGQIFFDMELTTEERRDLFRNLEDSSIRLLNTITDYMDMARIVSGTMDVNSGRVVLSKLFDRLEERGRIQCAKRETELVSERPDHSDDLAIISDKDLIEKCLTKLLDNACKFTDGGTITIGYRLGDNRVEFFVKDTGSGISPEKQDEIFGMFAQEDVSMTRDYEGSGLGLTISKGLVTLLGGSIDVVSEKGRGSEFTITLPAEISKEQVANDSKKARHEKSGSDSLILIAEDDYMNYHYIATLLDNYGYSHIRASDGAEAVTLCRSNPGISAVLMDIKMPVINGMEATRLIRETRPNLPVVATTAYAQTGDRERFLEAGCNDYLSKPIDKDLLLEMVARYTGSPHPK